jgi:hypothetical protein
MLSASKFQTVLLLVAVVTVFCMALSAQRTTSPQYNLKTEAKIKGIVEEVKLPATGSKEETAHLRVKNGADILDVYLCPESFLQDMGFTFSKGDEIALIGSKIKQEGTDLILAREVVKGTDTLVLQDDKGSPVWNWRH